MNVDLYGIQLEFGVQWLALAAVAGGLLALLATGRVCPAGSPLPAVQLRPTFAPIARLGRAPRRRDGFPTPTPSRAPPGGSAWQRQVAPVSAADFNLRRPDREDSPS